MTAPLQKERPSVDLTFSVQVSDGGLWFRQEIADGSTEHEGQQYEVEIATTVGGGSILVTIQRPEKERAKGETWRTYVFSPETLIRACMADYLKDAPKSKTVRKLRRLRRSPEGGKE